MSMIRLLLIIILLGAHVNAYASANDSRLDWMNADLQSITSVIPPCIEVPQFASMHQGNHSLNLDHTDQWVAAGTYVERDKSLQIEWSTRGVQPRPAKYRVMYRIDPRFSVPQVFIQAYNYEAKKFESDFHQFKNRKLLAYQRDPKIDFSRRIKDYSEYFSFNGRDKIQVKQGDVVNITLDYSGDFFGSDSEMNANLGTGDDLLLAYSQSSLPNNQIIYTNPTQWCSDAIKTGNTKYAENCAVAGKYWDVGANWKTFTGRVSNKAFELNKSEINPCDAGASGMDNNPLCYYDKGRGMAISVAGTLIKPMTEKFIYSPFSGKNFFYHKVEADGDLDFVSAWPIEGMYNGYDQFMKDWSTDVSSGLQMFFDLHEVFDKDIDGEKASIDMNFLHFGRYLFEIEVGSSSDSVRTEDLNNIEVKYTIMESGIPAEKTRGVSVDQNFRGNASNSGYLWLKVIRPANNMSGIIQVKTANYTGSTWFSDVIYGDLIQPLREKFNTLTMTFYQKLISNADFQNIARAMLILYVILYGLMFLAGAVQITVTDLVTRVVKIAVVVALFSENSWTFFTQNVFDVFVYGTDYLMSSVIGVTSQEGNIFGFVDPIFDKYTNPTIWALLFIQLLQVHTGMCFFAAMTIYSILIFFSAVLQVIVSYCLAFLGLAIMISLAPFFIVLILFERTKGIFDAWISTMFSYMMKPTLLLIFFLLIDQIMSDHIARTVVRACWDILIPIRIGIDLSHMGIDIDFSFELPFLPGIPFYIPQVSIIETMEDFFTTPGTFAMIATSSLLFFALCKLAKGLVDYVDLLVQYLTNVQAARQSGKLQGTSNPVKDIIGDMRGAIAPIIGQKGGGGRKAQRGLLGRATGFIKEKVSDQKITHKGKRGEGGDIDYDKMKKTPGSDVNDNNSENDKPPVAEDKIVTAGTKGDVIKVAADKIGTTEKDKKDWISAKPSALKKAEDKIDTKPKETPWKHAEPSEVARKKADESGVREGAAEDTKMDQTEERDTTPWQKATRSSLKEKEPREDKPSVQDAPKKDQDDSKEKTPEAKPDKKDDNTLEKKKQTEERRDSKKLDDDE